MSLRCLRIPALLILALPLRCPNAIARRSGAPAPCRAAAKRSSQPKVYTNDDVASPSSEAAPADATIQPRKAGDPGAQPIPAEGTGKASRRARPPQPAKSKPSPEQSARARELELDKRTQEINQDYLDKIARHTRADRRRAAGNRTASARPGGEHQSVPAHFRHQPVRIWNTRSSSACSTSRLQRSASLLVSLGSQLEDAQESARHAGVPHATD